MGKGGCLEMIHQEYYSTLFYYARMQFCLRGIQEQYDMRLRQLIRVPTDSQIYHEQVYYKCGVYRIRTNF